MLLRCKKRAKALCKFIFHLDHVGVTLATLLVMWIAVYLAFNIGYFDPVARTIENFRLTDVFSDISNTGDVRDTSDLITIVDMTDVYDRSKLAEIIDKIQACEPSVLGVDVVFDGLRNDSSGNERLVETVCNTTSPTVWAYKLTNWNSDDRLFESSWHSFFTKYVNIDHEGFVNIQRDTNGGTVRKLGLHRLVAGHTEYSLTAQVALAATNDSSIVTQSEDCNICFTSTDFPIIPSDNIMGNEDLIRSHIVLLGAMHDMKDQHYTPIGKIPGVNILAYAIQTLVQRRIPVEIPNWLLLIITFLIMWSTQILQDGITRFLKQADVSTIKYFIGDSGFASGSISIAVIILLVWLSFILFFRFNIYFNSVMAIMGIALLANVRKFYALFVRIIDGRTNWSIVKYSLYSYKT